jgi:hypothetical protein
LDCRRAGQVLPTPHAAVDVFWIELDQARSPARLLRVFQSCGCPTDGDQNDRITLGAVTDCIGDERHYRCLVEEIGEARRKELFSRDIHFHH